MATPSVSTSDYSNSRDGASTSNFNAPVYQQDDYSASSVAPPTNSFSSQYNSGISADSLLPLAGLEYTRKTTQQTPTSPAYEQTIVDERPTNGFNYRTYEIKTSPQPNHDFPYYRQGGKTESVAFEPISSTGLPNVQRSQLDDFSPVYHSVTDNQNQYEKNEKPGIVYAKNNEEQPLFLPIPQNKQEEYAYQTTVANVATEVRNIFMVLKLINTIF